jgi:hypothetical protein
MEFANFLRGVELDDLGQQLVSIFNKREITPIVFNDKEKIFLTTARNGFQLTINYDDSQNLFISILSKNDCIRKETTIEEFDLLIDTFFSKDDIEVVTEELQNILEKVEKKQTNLDKIMNRVKHLYESYTVVDLLGLVRELVFIKKYKTKDQEMLEEHLKFALRDALDDIRYMSYVENQ